MQDFKKIDTWKRAHRLVKSIYTATSGFPTHELFGITSQLRRAAVSIPTNIAEGSGKASNADFGRYLQISFGSCCEVEYLLLLSFELNYIPELNYIELNTENEEIKKMLYGFMKTLK